MGATWCGGGRKGEQLLSFMMILGALRRTVHNTVEKK
jgi:hypothetical protein